MRGPSVKTTGLSLRFWGEVIREPFLVVTADSLFSEYSSQSLETFNCERSVKPDFLPTVSLAEDKKRLKEYPLTHFTAPRQDRIQVNKGRYGTCILLGKKILSKFLKYYTFL